MTQETSIPVTASSEADGAGARILVVEDSPSYQRELQRSTEKELSGAVVTYVSTLSQALDAFDENRFDLMVMDVIFPLNPEQEACGKTHSRAGFELLDRLQSKSPSTGVVVLSGQDKQTAVDLLVRYRQVRDYLFKDTPWKEVVIRLRRHVEDVLESRRSRRDPLAQFIGDDERITKVKDMIRRVAPTDATVLIEGASGTGKELVARGIHHASGRWRGPFLPVNCAALSESLLESELFGHKKGAFTGAIDDRPGKFEAAASGSLFLDEVGELPLTLQPKLLRVLQEREVERLGENKIRKVDVRIVAATNRNLDRMVREGKFREDLYFRLNVFPIDLPRLRDRPRDIPLLLEHFRRELNHRMGRRIDGFSDEALTRLESQEWPGNIRELQNVLERVFILSEGPTLEWSDFSSWLSDGADGYAVNFPSDSSSYLDTKKRVMEVFDRKFFTRFLRKNRGQIEKTAQEIGYNRKDLRKKLNDLDLDRDEFKD